jgi:UDP-N-acetylglucosamine:LPS N-acetylglucosamine transferase
LPALILDFPVQCDHHTLKNKKEVPAKDVLPQVETKNLSPEKLNRINELRQIIQSEQQKFNSYKKQQSRQNVQNSIDKNVAELNQLLNS